MRVPTEREIKLGVKTCTQCQKEKKLDEFTKDKTKSKNKYHRCTVSRCKDCISPNRIIKGELYYLCGDVAYIPLYKRDGTVKFAKVDKEDIDRIMALNHNWHSDRDGYATCNNDRKRIRMHRAIIGLKDPAILCDHINHNVLDNRKSNLRPCTPSENMWNRSKNQNNLTGLKGISFNKRAKKWRAQVSIGGVEEYLGSFKTKEEAASAYDRAAKELHGEFYYNPDFENIWDSIE